MSEHQAELDQRRAEQATAERLAELERAMADELERKANTVTPEPPAGGEPATGGRSTG